MYKFPGTNFQSLNLDWILNQVKTMMTDWQQLRGEFADLETDWETEKTWFEEYLSTHYQGTILTFMNGLVANGTIQSYCVAPAQAQAQIITDAWIAANLSQETGYVLDASLTLANAAAQAKEAGTEIGFNRASIDNMVDMECVYSINDYTWTRAGLYASTGGPRTASNMIRTGYIMPPVSVRVASGFKYHVHVYDSNETYIGILERTGNYVKENSYKTGTQNLIGIPSGYKIRLCVMKTDESDMAVTDGANISISTYTDKLLSDATKAANAQTVGDEIVPNIPRLGRVNLFNPSDTDNVDGQYISSFTDGVANWTSSTTIGETGYMPIRAGQRLVIILTNLHSLSTGVRVAWFTSNKTGISVSASATSGNYYLAPENAAYVRVAYTLANKSYMVCAILHFYDTLPFSATNEPFVPYTGYNLPEIANRVDDLEDLAGINFNGPFTWSMRSLGLRIAADANGCYYIPFNALGMGVTRGNGTYGNSYVRDNIHPTKLGGYNVACGVWSYLRHIPVWHTTLPEAVSGDTVPASITEALDGTQWSGKTWYAYGTSLTAESSGYYTDFVAAMGGLTLVNKGTGGQGLVTHRGIFNALLDMEDGKLDADLITIEVGANDSGVLGDPWGLDTNEFYGALNYCIKYMFEHGIQAQVVIMCSYPSRYASGDSSNRFDVSHVITP